MLKAVSSLLLVFATVPAMAAAEGFAVGTIGVYDGQSGMMLGKDSSAAFRVTFSQVAHNSKFVSGAEPINPLHFEYDVSDPASKETLEKAEHSKAPVVVHFDENLLGSFQVTHVEPVQPSIVPEVCNAHPKTHLPIKGSVSGRLVRLSLEGYRDPVRWSVSSARKLLGYSEETSARMFMKVWEATIQVGDSGNQFVHLTITDSKMFDCLMKSIESNHPAKFSFAEVKHPNTLQYVNDLETLEPLN